LKGWGLDRNKALRWLGITIRLHRIVTSAKEKKVPIKDIFEPVSLSEITKMFSTTAVDANVLVLLLATTLYLVDNSVFKESSSTEKVKVLKELLMLFKGIEYGE
jgi:hypothetical protein